MISWWSQGSDLCDHVLECIDHVLECIDHVLECIEASRHLVKKDNI